MFNLDESIDITPPDNISTYDPRSVLGKNAVLQLNLGLEILDDFCSYVIDVDNEDISNSAIENTKILFEMLDTRPYMNNDSLMARIEYIQKSLEARVTLGLDKKSLINSYVLKNCDHQLKDIIEEEVIKGCAKIKLKRNIVKYINSSVYDNLIESYSIIFAPKIINLYDKMRDGQFKSMTDYASQFKDTVTEMNTCIQDAERYKLDGQTFDLSEKSMRNTVRKVLRDFKMPSNKLRTGIQALNKMVNGGFESGRSYLFAGLTGVGKSIVLLSIANWIRKYNKLQTNNGEHLAVLFISQENSKNETFERLFNMDVSTDDLRNLSEEDVIKGLKKSGMMIPDGDNESINLIFRKYDDKEIGVSDIDNLITDYERKGVRIIAVVQDYIEKLRPKFKTSEMRFALGNAATELSELAKKRNIPVISAAQLNRMASSVVDNAIANNKKNTIKLLGKQNVSESWDMMKNVDAVILINREIDDASDVEKQYLGFKLEKFRGKPNEDRIYVFLHPFDENNGISLTADIDTKPLSRNKMEDFEPLQNQPVKSTGSFDLIGSDFGGSFIDIIDDDYKDTSQHYIDIMNKAEEVANKMRIMQERENEIKRERQLQLEKANGEIVLSAKQSNVLVLTMYESLKKHSNILVLKHEADFNETK